jgi:hypothetical protein
MTANNPAALSADSASKSRYIRFLLLVAGLGGLLYGIDVGIIAGALPYLEATSHLTAAQLSSIVAAALPSSSQEWSGIAASMRGKGQCAVCSCCQGRKSRHYRCASIDCVDLGTKANSSILP